MCSVRQPVNRASEGQPAEMRGGGGRWRKTVEEDGGGDEEDGYICVSK